MAQPVCRRPSGMGQVIALLLHLIVSGPALAQDARAYTTVADLVEDPSGGTIIARSLTLIHGGKVYDEMVNLGEVVIFEPAHRRFVLLNSRYRATTVSFEELRQFLNVARFETERTLETLAPRQDERSQHLFRALHFQLDPNFRVSRESNLIQLQGEQINYRVTTSTPPSRQLAQQYLEYADWAAQLNFALHPHSQFPEVRRAVNDQMRAADVLPRTVELRSTLDVPVHLRAEHRYEWELQSFDRSLIDKWERMIESDRIEWVSFRDYQRLTLSEVSQMSTRR